MEGERIAGELFTQHRGWRRKLDFVAVHHARRGQVEIRFSRNSRMVQAKPKGRKF